MRLHELTSELRHFEAMLDENEGEIDEESFAQALEGLNVEIDAKAANLALWVKEMKAQENAVKAEEDRLSARRKALANRQERVKAYLAYCLDETVKTELVTVSKRKGRESLVITDASLIPSEYLIPQPDKIDKAAIKAAAKDGASIPGAAMSRGNDFVVIT